jgi:type II secretion system protein N
MRNRILTISLYSLFFLFCLFFFLVRGFPVKILADQMKSSLEQELGVNITTGSMSVLFPNGVKATDVRFVKAGREEAPAFSVFLDMVKVRISLLGLLIGHRNVSFGSELFSGSLDGAVSLGGERVQFNTQIEHIDLNKFPLLADIVGMKFKGIFSGTIDLNFTSHDLKTATGVVQVDLDDAAIGEGTVGESADSSGGFSIPPIRLGKVQINLQVDRGKAELKTFKQQSDDLEVNAEGYVLMAQRFDQFTQNCRVRFKPSASFLAKNPKFQTVIDLSGMTNATDPQGYIVYKVMGKLTNPQFQPVKR